MGSKVEQLCFQADSLVSNFKQESKRSHIDQAIALDREALSLCPPGHPERASSLIRLSIHLEDRYNQLGAITNVEEAIVLSRDALELNPPGHPMRPVSLNWLSVFLWDRYQQLGGMEDLVEAIVLGKDALSLRPPGHPDRSTSLHNVASCLATRYQRLGGVEDLDEAILLAKDALSLRPLGNPDRSKTLNSIALYLCSRYRQLGGAEDLEEAIVLGKDSLELRPPGHPDRSKSLSNTSLYLFTRYQQFGRMEDLDEAICLGKDAVLLFQSGHPLLLKALNNVTIYLTTRYEWLGNMEDLDDAIVLARNALALCPPGHPDRPKSLSNTALYLCYRFKRLGGMGDLDEAIVLGRDAVALCPQGHPDRSTSLNNVAVYLSTRYQQLGGMGDLDEAIILGRDTLLLRPAGHPDRLTTMINVANHLFTRYQQLGGMEDLDEAIALGRDALGLLPPGHPDRSVSLISIANHLFARYQRLGEIEGLDEAIKLTRDALVLCPPGHPDRSISLNNIANYLSTRFQWSHGIEDIDEAIILGRDALKLRPSGHPDRSMSQNNVACYLYSRYKQLGGSEDLDEAIVLGRDSLTLRPPGHPGRSQSLGNLASYLCARFARSNHLQDKQETFDLYTQMACIPPTPSFADISATRAWIAIAEDFEHPTTLLAYETSLQILVHHLATLPSLLPQHLDLLKDLTSSLAADAFSACLRSRSLSKAVELLEQGRGIFWSQLSLLRSTLDHVVMSSPEGKILADEFVQLTSLIRRTLDSPGSDQHDRVCHLNVELQRVVTAIRGLPGLSRFFLPSLFSDLRQAASGGPVIIVNASNYSCDALVILLDRDPVHIPLQITREDVRQMSSKLHTWTIRVKLMDAVTATKHLASILRELWDKVVSSVVDSLQTVCPPQSRIWWCPTAEFTHLPLHAAGPYRKGQRRLADIYVSSYTPTLTALIRARRYDPSICASQKKKFVGIGQAKVNGETDLHSVGAELMSIGLRVNDHATFTHIEGSDSCISRVAEELNRNNWVHFACHGLPNRQEPLKSAFALHDGHFTIERIMRCELPNAQFAYLSACHTTVGYKDCPDEMIHLASAMQFAGFRSVIGTMWAVEDKQAKKFASMFYDNMVNGLGRLDHTHAAFALHKTMMELEGVTFDQRILYVHLGA